MIPHPTRSLLRPILGTLLAFAASASMFAAEGLAVHGSVSATAAYSDRYNFLGQTDSTLDLNTVELVLNGSHRFESGLRLSVQLYAYQIDDYKDLALDFAALDYSFNEAFGIRAGRIKRPGGLYGESQDIDIVRPFAFLPSSLYEKTLRPLVSAFDGAAIYGTISLHSAGSLEYQASYGWLPKIAADTPYIAGVGEGSLNNYNNIENDTVWAGSLAWNTSLEGLKFMITGGDAQGLVLSGPMKTAAQLALAPSDARATPSAFPPGVYDFLMAGKSGSLSGNSGRYTVSAEYTHGAWQFAAEYLLVKSKFTVAYPAPIGSRISDTKSDAYYVSGTWQANDKLQLGLYYSETYADKHDHSGNTRLIVPKHTAYLKDTAFAASYGLTSWWLLKGEIHLNNGTRGLTAASNGDALTWEPRWTYFVLKSTVSF